MIVGHQFTKTNSLDVKRFVAMSLILILEEKHCCVSPLRSLCLTTLTKATLS